MPLFISVGAEEVLCEQKAFTTAVLADHLFYYIDNISKLSLWDQNWSLKYCSVFNRKIWKQQEKKSQQIPEQNLSAFGQH